MTFANSETKEPARDPRLDRALEELDAVYRLGEDGFYQVGVDLADGRTHLCMLSAATLDVHGVETRFLHAIAAEFEGDLDPELANHLLLRNALMAIGTWCILPMKGDMKRLILVEELDPDMPAEQLGPRIAIAAKTADDLENELTGEDRF